MKNFNKTNKAICGRVVAMGLWFLSTGGLTAQTTMRFAFSPEEVGITEANGYTLLSLKNELTPDLAPGVPMVPARYVNILLPDGAEFASLDVKATELLFAENTRLYPAQPPCHSGTPPPTFVGPDAEAYARVEPTPATWAEYAGVQEMRGRRFVTVRLNPLRYRAAARQVWLASEIEVTVNSRAVRLATPTGPMSSLFGDMLNQSVVNPEPARRAKLPSTNRIPYLVITRAALTNAFASLTAHRETLFPSGTAIVTVEEILAAFPGRDDPEKIRHFIVAAVATNETDYIVLGGDDTIVPTRFCGIAAETHADTTPVDLYYSGLDGDWDANENNIFGELADNVDMAPDVIVSRIPVRTAQDVDHYTAKLMAYESGARADVYGKMLLSGTEGWNLIYGSARGTDDVFDSYASFRSHQPVSDAEHWVRRIYRDVIQPYWSASTLDIFFDTLTTWDKEFAGDFKQTPERFVEVYNQGWEHQYIDTHGSWNLYALANGERFSNTNAASLTNLTCFLTTVACLTSHFDSTNDPCLAEAFLRGAAGSLVYHGCSRLGWGEFYPTHTYGGPSPEYAMQYMERLFNGSSTSVGQAYTLGKAHFTGICTSNGTYRWLQFGINLLGDPAVPPRANPLPAAPILRSAINTNLPVPGIFLEWQDPSTHATGFDLQRSGGTDNVWRVIGSTSATSYFDSGAPTNAFVLYRVRATNDAGHSIWSDAGGLVMGTLPADAWDPSDDAPAGATALTNLIPTFTHHGPHTLSATDTNDWFRFDVTQGFAYQFTTDSSENFGGLYAHIYDGQMNLVAEDGDSNGLNRFSFFLTPTNTETWHMQIEPNRDRDSASYHLYYRAEENQSGSAALGAALDATQLVWRTSTQTVNPWFAQTNVFKFGGRAAQSGQIYRPDDTTTLYAAYSWIETSMEVASPAFLSFWLKTELDPGAKLIYDVPEGKATVEETTDWSQKFTSLFDFATTTVVTLRFEMTSADSANPINSRAWLDQFHLIQSSDMLKLSFGQATSNLLTSGNGHVYVINVAEIGFGALDIHANGIVSMRAYNENGYSCTVESVGSNFRWLCEAPGTYYLMLENHSADSWAYEMTASFHNYRYVNAASTHFVPPYTSWATAAATIQDAVDVANEGDIVLVTNGTYAVGGRAAGGSFTLTNRVCITNAIAVRSIKGAAYTVIVGANDLTSGGKGESAVRCVWLANGASLVGFTLSNGWTSATNNLEIYGGGVWCQSTNARLEQCSLSGNVASFGGGAYRGTLKSCELLNNQVSDVGGGAFESRLEACTLMDNQGHSGGGAYDCILYNCLLSRNSALEQGGGAYGGALYNCTLLGNSADRGGGVARVSEMVNGIAYYNRAESADPNLYLYDSTNLVNLCVTPAPTVGSGHITNAPLIAGVANPRLLPGSPCINAGMNQSWMTNATDCLERTRIMYGTVDIGANEFEQEVQMGELAASITADCASVAMGYPVQFTADIRGECLGFVWQLGDGQTVTNEAVFTHAYSLPGRYDVILQASNLSLTIAVSTTVQVVTQSVYYVSPVGDHVAPFSSWENAATTIQAAVDVAIPPGSIVWVTNGIYATGGRTADRGSTLTNRVCITNQAITVRSVNGPAQTAIVGAKDPETTNGDLAVRCVWLASGSVLEGFTLTNGATLAWELNVSEDDYSGGGAGCQSVRAILTNCVVSGNSAHFGGGVHQGELYNCLLRGNQASRYGGGAAGKVDESHSRPIHMVNCTIVENSASNGGGVYHGEVHNSIVFGNQATESETNYDGSCTLFTSCATPLPTNGIGNIAADPCLTSAGHLQSNSPCVNAGTNEDWMGGATDLAGSDRIQNAVVDMGAYESAWWGMYADVDDDGFGDWTEINVTGTDPTNAASFLGMVNGGPMNESTNGRIVRWTSVEGKRYRVDRATNLLGTPTFTNWLPSVAGLLYFTTVTDTTATAEGPFFYRVGIPLVP